MNLIDAIKSGRNIRRRDRKFWTRFNKNLGETMTSITDPSLDQWMSPDFYLNGVGVDKDDLLSDEWEVQDNPVSITRRMFWDAYEAILKENFPNQFNHELIPLLLKKLGLG